MPSPDESDDELPFTAQVTVVSGSTRITIPAAVRKALNLEAGDVVIVRLRKRKETQVVIDDRILRPGH